MASSLLKHSEATLAAGHQAAVPVMIGANNRDLGIGRADSKDALFVIFGADATEARKLYDPRGDQTLDELKQQLFAYKSMTEPARHLANMIARAGQPVWLYRFSYVAESQREKLKGTLHGFEIPYTFDIPAALVGDIVTAADKAMGALASAYWVSFARTGDPNGGVRTHGHTMIRLWTGWSVLPTPVRSPGRIRSRRASTCGRS